MFGKQGTNSGKTFSEQHKRRMSESQKGKVVSLETRRKISNTLSGRKQTQESIRKSSESRTGKDRGGKRYEAFGESKTIAQWSKDYRCMVCDDVLYNRIVKYGWEVERSILTPNKRGK